MTITAGLHVVSTTLDDLYVNGAFVGRWQHDPTAVPVGPRVYGTAVTMTQLANGVTSGAHVDALEFRTAPGGTLLHREDFTTLSAWTQVSVGGPGPFPYFPAAFDINPASHARGNDLNANEMYRTAGVPVGTGYVEAQGVYFDNPTPPGGALFGVSFYRHTGNDRTPGQSMLSGNQGHFLIVSSAGVVVAGMAQLLVGAGPAGGWAIGGVRIG